MSLANWVIVKGGSSTSGLVGTGAITGATSLQLFGSSGQIIAALPASRGITVGRIRSLYKVTALGSGNKAFGMWTMMQPDVASYDTTNTRYYMVMYGTATSFPATFTPQLKKANADPEQSGGGSLVSGSGITMSNASDVHSLEFEWQYDPPNGSVLLVCRVGTATDFSDLTTSFTFVHASSILASSMGCGLFANSSSGTITTLWDSTTVYKH